MFSFKVKYAIQILSEIRQCNLKSQSPRLSDLRRKGGFEADELKTVVKILRKKHWIAHDEYHYRIEIDLASVTLYDLMITMNEDLHMGDESTGGWLAKTRSKYDRAMSLDVQLTAEFELRLKEFTLSEIICANSATVIPLIKQPSQINERKLGA